MSFRPLRVTRIQHRRREYGAGKRAERGVERRDNDKRVVEGVLVGNGSQQQLDDCHIAFTGSREQRRRVQRGASEPVREPGCCDMHIQRQKQTPRAADVSGWEYLHM